MLLSINVSQIGSIVEEKTLEKKPQILLRFFLHCDYLLVEQVAHFDQTLLLYLHKVISL